MPAFAGMTSVKISLLKFRIMVSDYFGQSYGPDHNHVEEYGQSGNSGPFPVVLQDRQEGPAYRSDLSGQMLQDVPRTMPRYAIEKLPQDERQAYLQGAR